MTQQTKAQRLAGLLNSFTVSRPQASTLKDTATLLRRQEKLLGQALEAMVRGTPAEYESVIAAIRAHLEAK